MGRAEARHRPPYLRDRYELDREFRSQVEYAAGHGIPLSVYLGRVPAAGEPDWLPEDRDVVAVWQQVEVHRCSGCGRHPWEDIPDGWEAGYDVCQWCKEAGEAYEEAAQGSAGVRARENMYGVRVGFFPPSPAADSQGVTDGD